MEEEEEEEEVSNLFDNTEDALSFLANFVTMTSTVEDMRGGHLRPSTSCASSRSRSDVES